MASKYIYKSALFFFALSIFGLYLAEYAKAVPSIAMIGLVVTGIASAIQQKITLKNNLHLVVLPAGCALLYAIQFIDSENMAYLLERIKIKLPIIILPLALLSIPVFKKRDLSRIILIYIAVTTFTAIFISIEFFSHYEMYIEKIKQSQIVRGPINHIRFSLMAVMSAFLCYFLLKNKDVSLNKGERIFLIGSMFFTIFFIHIYSVRSGIISLYALIFYLLVLHFIKTRNVKVGIISVLIFLATPFVVYQFSNSIKSKITATVNDLSDYRQHKNNEFNSLGKRFLSYEMAFEVLKENPLFGCGIGDLIDVNTELFKTKHPEIGLVIIPHNQFIYYLMGSGIVGTLLFCITFFFPLFYRKNYLNMLITGQYLILFLSFQTEPMLETQLGVAYAILFLLLGMAWSRSANETEVAAV